MLFCLVMAIADWVRIYKFQGMPSGKQTERVFFLSAFDVSGGEASLARVTHNTMFAILLASTYLSHSPFWY
jgi:hypothetical protein